MYSIHSSSQYYCKAKFQYDLRMIFTPLQAKKQRAISLCDVYFLYLLFTSWLIDAKKNIFKNFSDLRKMLSH